MIEFESSRGNKMRIHGKATRRWTGQPCCAPGV